MNANAVSNYGPKDHATLPEIGAVGTSSPHDSYDVEDGKTSDDKLIAETGPGSPNAAEDREDVKIYQKKLPALDLHNGVGSFFGSLGHRLRAMLTPRLLLCLVVSAFPTSFHVACA